MRSLCLALVACTPVLCAVPVAAQYAAGVVYDTDFAVTVTQARLLRSAGSPATLSLAATVRNHTGGPAQGARLGVVSPLLLAPVEHRIPLGDLPAGQAVAVSVGLELAAPPIPDEVVLGSLLWRIEYEDPAGAPHRRHVAAGP